MNSADKTPLYYQLALQIEENIEKGIWRKGEPIPSERELIKLYNISRITVRNAIDELVKRGKLEKIHGKGTYVLEQSIVQNLGNLYSFSKEMEKQGKISKTKLLKLQVIPCDFKIASKLQINEGDEIIYLERLRCTEEDPVMVERSYFIKNKYSFIMDIDFSSKSLYKTLENDYGIIINKVKESFSACMLTENECMKLGIHHDQYGLLVKRTSFHDEEVVCYSTTVAPGNKFEFTIQLQK